MDRSCSWRRSILQLTSLDVEVEVRVLTAPVQLDDEMIGGPEARERLHRVFGIGEVETIDRLQPIALLEAEHAEDRVRANAEELEPEHLSVLLKGNDAQVLHELRLSVDDLGDGLPIDVEL